MASKSDKHPFPNLPAILFEKPGVFVPSLAIERWMRFMFIDTGPFHNPDHLHLQHARIGVLLTNAEQTTLNRRVLGQASLGKPTGTPWAAGQRAQQIEGWFECIPDFLITLDAMFLSSTGDLERCALIEHELYHCAQATDQWGSPKFHKKTGKPIYKMRGHDIEEFTGVVQRYGAWSMDLDEFKEALRKPPTIGRARVDGICACGKEITRERKR